METLAEALSLPVSETRGPERPAGMERKELGARREAKRRDGPLHRLPAPLGVGGGEGAKENAPGEMADHSRLLKF